MFNQMKIVLATGVFYPDVGGPAIHCRKIAEMLTERGFKVVVVTYGENPEGDNFKFSVKRISRKIFKPLRWFIYSVKVFFSSFDASVIYAFDVTAAGMPAFLTAKLFGKRFIVRIGGDPIWERVVEKGKRFVSITKYYKDKFYLVDKPYLFRAIRFMLGRTDKIVTYCFLLRDLYVNYYEISKDKIELIFNPFLKKESLSASLKRQPKVLFAGRFVSYKNLYLVIGVFERIRKSLGKGELVLIGDGPDEEILKGMIKKSKFSQAMRILPKMPQEKLFEHIQSSLVCVGPALTEFNPNFILESLSLGKPVLLSKENGLTVKLPEEFLFDPNNEDEFKMKLERFFDDNFYKEAVGKVKSLSMDQTWEEVLDMHWKLINKLL
ncbi:glycosyltransferase [Candidatus Parcubacteria bacterium]|nr:MAG: glycosyltransferase [Candidatus Parcubacteria bacterium]